MNVPEKYLAYIEMIVSTARVFMAEGNVFQGMAFLGKFGAGIVPVPVNMMDKDRSVMMLKELCKRTEPDYVMMISEAWMVERKDASKADQDDLLNEYKAHKGLADHPERVEIVMLSLETQEGLWFGKSPIKSLGDGKRGFDDLEFTMTTQLEGRFACFLPQSGPVH